MRTAELLPGEPPHRAPARGEVHLHFVDLLEIAGAERGLRCFLSADEIGRVSRFQTEQARSRFVRTRGALRTILARSLDVTPERIKFSYSVNGKPALAGEWHNSDLTFNVSHSADYALIGLTTGRAIGVDIEHVRPMLDSAAIASQYFSESEMRGIASLAEAERLRGFFRCWARKEAFMKATGEGMAIALNGFSVSLDDDAEPGLAITDARIPGGEWSITGVSLFPECEAAVAVNGGKARICAWRNSVSP